MLYQLLRDAEGTRTAAEEYLARAVKLIQDTLRECLTPPASLGEDGTVDFGEGGWECILQVRRMADGRSKVSAGVVAPD